MAMSSARRLSVLFCCQVFSISGFKSWADVTESCLTLLNDGGWHYVRVGVGTPPQSLDLLVDTGHSGTIVKDCRAMRGDTKKTKCFTGEKSTTYELGGHHIKLEFGSGNIFGQLGTDVVVVGKSKALMSEGVVFWHSSKGEAFEHAPLEGILGLGLPQGKDSALAGSSWLAAASIQRFSMCFSGAEEGGILRLNPPAAKMRLGNIGRPANYWALNLQGVSSGDAKAKVAPCGGEKSSDAACALIVDSGTQMITAPRAQLPDIYSSICDAWPRCKQLMGQRKSSAPESEIKMDKLKAVESLLEGCQGQEWATDAAALNKELPPLYWHVGAGGQTETLKLAASSYVVLIDSGDKSGPLCYPGIQQMDIQLDALTGPLIIIGTPLFNEYEVQFDLSTDTISFSPSSCGSTAQMLSVG
ncbi:PAG2 [Symbiodinium natans]|uniref:PAG2 protein n=1 Tax=Symbiodinium natans TaxID=878477 RepID=A0A812MQG8_9DINO|nr:PAG2 [Symbiodinium natans]